MRGALGDPVRPTRPRVCGLIMAMLSQCWEYVGSYNSQSALRQYSVLLSALFLVTVVYRNLMVFGQFQKTAATMVRKQILQ